jgi:hypothetical protein
VSASEVRSGRRRRPSPAGGFYDGALTEAERAELPAAKKLDGLDEEIALIRLRLRSALEQHPQNLTLMAKGIELLVKALSARYKLTKDDKTQVLESMRRTLREISGPLYPEVFGDGGRDGN